MNSVELTFTTKEDEVLKFTVSLENFIFQKKAHMSSSLVLIELKSSSLSEASTLYDSHIKKIGSSEIKELMINGESVFKMNNKKHLNKSVYTEIGKGVITEKSEDNLSSVFTSIILELIELE